MHKKADLFIYSSLQKSLFLDREKNQVKNVKTSKLMSYDIKSDKQAIILHPSSSKKNTINLNNIIHSDF